MRAITIELLSRLRATWSRVLAIHLIYTGLGVVLFAPLLGVLGRALLELSGEPALADMDLLFFALSPLGIVSLAVFAAAAIVISAFELASMMAVFLADAQGRRADVLSALVFGLRRARLIFIFGLRLVVKLLVLVAPFLILGGITAFWLLTDFDINYYLTVRPAEFWLAAAILALLGLVLLVLLLRRLIEWSLALPLVLFVATPPASSFADSTALTHKSRGLIFGALLTWGVAVLLLGAIVATAARVLASQLVPWFAESVTTLAMVFGFLSVLSLAATVLLAALTTGSLALLIAALADHLEPRFRAGTPDLQTTHGVWLGRLTRRKLALAVATSAGVAVAIGYILLDEIAVVDTAEIIAHRGAAGAAPENTLASVRRAVADGADWIEIDVQETADGQVVVIHDSDFMKLAGVNLTVWEATLAQLEDIDIGGWFAPEFADERVPTLAAVLAEVKGRAKLIVELKYYGHDQRLEQRVIDLIEAAGMQDDIMIMSLEYAGIQKVRALRPDWVVGLLSARAIGDLTRLDADFLAVNVGLARSGLVRAAHNADKQLYVWTVNDALTMSQMMSLGVDGIITDEPLLGREVLAARAGLSAVGRLLLRMAPLFGLELPDLGSAAADVGRDAGIADRRLELDLHDRFQRRVAQLGGKLAEFTTDGCSGGLSVGWRYFSEQVGSFRDQHGVKPPWESCCVEHDRRYHAGGAPGLSSDDSFAAREQADAELRACVVATTPERSEFLQNEYGLTERQVDELYDAIAESMFVAVRLGGMPCTGLSWRWGYGWPDCG